MLPLELFRSRNFAGANLLTLFLYTALGGVFFFLPLDLIQVQGYSAVAAGASMLPFILIVFVLSRWSGGLFDRIGAKAPLVAGPAVAAAGFALFALPGAGGSYWTTFFPAMVVVGLGMATSIAPLTTTVMTSVADRHAGAASGINNAVSRTAGLRKSGVRPELRTAIASQATRLAAVQFPSGATNRERESARSAVNSAFVAGFRRVMLLAAALALLASGGAAWLVAGRRRS